MNSLTLRIARLSQRAAVSRLNLNPLTLFRART